MPGKWAPPSDDPASNFCWTGCNLKITICLLYITSRGVERVVLKILGVLAGGVGLGAVLGWRAFELPVRAGWLGLVVLVGGALFARRYWSARRRRSGDEPGWPEQEIWHGLAGEALIGGYLITSLSQQGFAFEMHSVAGHTMAVDTWTMVAGAVVSYFILHDGAVRRDERDLAHAALALRAGFAALLIFLIAMILGLGFGPPELLARLAPALLAHVLIVILVVAFLVQHVTQLVAYWRDAREE